MKSELKYSLCPETYPYIRITPTGLFIDRDNGEAPEYITPQSYTIIMPDDKTTVSLESLIECYCKHNG